MSLADLPSGVFCIALGHSLDDPDVIEYYLQNHPVATEKCLPLAIRDVLSATGDSASSEDGVMNIPIPTAKETIAYLKLLWDSSSLYDKINMAVTSGAPLMIHHIVNQIRDTNSTAPFWISRDIAPNMRNYESFIQRASNIAMYSAAKRNDIVAAEILYELGAQLSSIGHAAMRTAEKYGHTEMIKFLTDHGVKSYSERI